MNDAVETAILNTAAAGIKTATVDGVTTEVLPIADQIKADQYLALRQAVCNRNRGIRFNKAIPAGAMDDRGGTYEGRFFP